MKGETRGKQANIRFHHLKAKMETQNAHLSKLKSMLIGAIPPKHMKRHPSYREYIKREIKSCERKIKQLKDKELYT